MSSDALISGSEAPPAPARAVSAVTHFHLLFATSLVFLAPNILFASALQPFPGTVLLVGCAVAAALLWRAPRTGFLAAPADPVALLACFATGLALCLLGGHAHLFYSNIDWLTRDAVLADLVTHGFAVQYAHDGQTYLLRAPLGMYALPALLGQAFGLAVAHVALLLQNAFILGSIAYFSSRLMGVGAAAALFFIFAFSGLDALPFAGAGYAALQRGVLLPLTYMEIWPYLSANVRLEYSSPLTQIFWAPNHMAPAWWFVVLALLHARGALSFGALAAAFATLPFWSPLAMIGALPFMLYFAFDARRALLAPSTIAGGLGALCFLPIAAYFAVDSASVKHGFMFGEDNFGWIYPIFIAVEIPQAAIVVYCWRRIEPCDRTVAAIAILSLLLIPFYGAGPYNDFAMRVSLAPLFVLNVLFARVAFVTHDERRPLSTLIALILLLGGLCPLAAIYKQATTPRYSMSDCNLATSWHKTEPMQLPTNYWARIEMAPAWLISPAGQIPLVAEQRQCWPDHPTLSETVK